MSNPTSPADHLVELIQSSRLVKFTSQEKAMLDDISCLEADGHLLCSARIAVRGRNGHLIVSSPHKVTEGLIQFFTPTETESCCVLPLEVIEGVYFTQ